MKPEELAANFCWSFKERERILDFGKYQMIIKTEANAWFILVYVPNFDPFNA